MMFDEFSSQVSTNPLMEFDFDDFLFPSTSTCFDMNNQENEETNINFSYNPISPKLLQNYQEETNNIRFYLPDFRRCSFVFNHIWPKHNNFAGNFPVVSYDPRYIGIQGNLELAVKHSLGFGINPFQYGYYYSY